MKRTSFVIAILCASFCTLFAGPAVEYKHPEPTSCGTGWYLGLQGGANVFQDFGDDRERNARGTQVTVGVNDHIGGFGGIKVGYVFGDSDWRFGLEEDLFYNGVDATAFAKIGNNEIASTSA